MDNIQAIGILQSLKQVVCLDDLNETGAMHNRNEALRMAIEALKEKENTIVLGRDYWYRYFDITEKIWRTEDGEVIDTSFCITKKGEGDDD